MYQNDLARIAEEYYRLAKRVVRVVVGFTVLAAGVAMIVLPGPAFVVIPIALAILAGEFVWARRLLNRVKTQVAHYTGYGKEDEEAIEKNGLDMPESGPTRFPGNITSENKVGVSAGGVLKTPGGRA